MSMHAGNKIKLMIVEDLVSQVELLMHLIMSCPNFDIVGVARNGVEAIELLRTVKPNVILMDLHMPKMNRRRYDKTYYEFRSVTYCSDERKYGC